MVKLIANTSSTERGPEFPSYINLFLEQQQFDIAPSPADAAAEWRSGVRPVIFTGERVLHCQLRQDSPPTGWDEKAGLHGMRYDPNHRTRSRRKGRTGGGVGPNSQTGKGRMRTVETLAQVRK